MKKNVLMHCKHCQVCAKQKVEKTKYIKDNFRPGSMPMEFISMDLVGWLSKTSSGHEYALTVICMLTGYVFCITLKTKTAEEIVDKYLTHVPFTFWNSRKILSDNGTEFKNTLFKRWPNNWELKGRFIHWCTGPKLMDISKDFTSSWKNTSPSTWWTI